MALYVKKFGGTSLATLDHIFAVADKIIEARKQNHDVTVVVSAMAGETDRLAGLAKMVSIEPESREYDALLATGETACAALLSMALIKKGCPAVSLTARQVRMLTDNKHQYAHLKTVELNTLKQHLKAGKVPVVTGFQGVNEYDETTTLGRGGSDATAVALAAALSADECQIYTDVEGVFSADPNMIGEAHCIPQVSYDEMLQLADSGAKVMQRYGVELAAAKNVDLRVQSSFKESEGTLLTEQHHFDEASVTSIACQKNLVLIRLTAQLPARELQQAVSLLARESVALRHLSQQYYSHGQVLSLIIDAKDFILAKSLLEAWLHSWPQMVFTYEMSRSEVAVVGRGIDHQIYLQCMSLLTELGIVPDMVVSSPLKLSFLMDERSLQNSLPRLHNLFNLATLTT